MPRGRPPAWRRRDTRYQHIVQAALAKGFGVVCVYNGIETEDRADDVRRGIHRSAGHLGHSASAAVHPAGKRFEVWFAIHPKPEARKHVLKTYGQDPRNWPYNPFQRGGAT